jgi:hypothetical protein
MKAESTMHGPVRAPAKDSNKARAPTTTPTRASTKTPTKAQLLQENAVLQARIAALEQREQQTSSRADMAYGGADRAFAKRVLDEMPAIICILEGPRYICRHVNAFGLHMLAQAGIEPSEQPLERILPGLREQGLLAILDHVYQTGQSLALPETYYVFEGADAEPSKT